MFWFLQSNQPTYNLVDGPSDRPIIGWDNCALFVCLCKVSAHREIRMATTSRYDRYTKAIRICWNPNEDVEEYSVHGDWKDAAMSCVKVSGIVRE
jgi:hypothetical protein